MVRLHREDILSMIELQEGDVFSCPDLLSKDDIYWPVCKMMLSTYTNTKGKKDNFCKNNDLELIYWESKLPEL